METTNKQQINTSINPTKIVNWVQQSRFAFMATSITLGSAWGSVAVYYILSYRMAFIFLIISTIFTMGANAIAIAQAPAKWVAGSTVLALIINTLIILVGLF